MSQHTRTQFTPGISGWLAVLAIAISGLLASESLAEVHRNGLISTIAAHRYGLERSWYTNMQVDRGRGHLRYVDLHINTKPELARTEFEVTYRGGRLIFSDRGRDAFGKWLGVQGAQKMAEEKVAELKAAKRDPVVMTKRTVEQATIYGISDRAMVHAIDAETGRTRWAVTVGRRDFPTLASAANNDYVVAINGSTLYVLDQSNGEVLWQRKAKYVPGAGPAISEEMVFIPSVSGELESFSLLEPRKAPGIFKSHGRAVIQPIVTNASVAWPTDRGHLYVGHSNKKGVRYRLEANRTIVAKAASLPPNKLFVSSVDGYVYSLQEFSGSILWRLSTGEPISQSPIPIGDTVYAITDRSGMVAIDAESGVERWWVPGVKSFLASSNDRLYVVDKLRQLVVLDRKSGGQIASMSAAPLDLLVQNTQTDRIYVGNQMGTLQCLREAELRYPVMHLGGVEQAAAAKPEVKQQGLQPMGVQPMPVPGANPKDPFAAPMPNANPFGPPAKPAAGNSNPFDASPPAGGSPNPFDTPADPGNNPFK